MNEVKAGIDNSPAVGELDGDEIRRYGRHLVMPEVGLEGQARLKAASVLVIGAGGLGSPVSMYLAAAGVGRLGLADYDLVDESNLQRQILYGTSDVGRPKLQAAASRLREINPHIEVVEHAERVEAANAMRLVSDYDVVVDGSDNFPTRYLINDSSLHLRIPVVHGSALRFEGSVSLFQPYRGPCYRCLFPEPPPPELSPSCGEAGVLGAVTGIIGAMQAAESVKWLVGTGTALSGRLLVYDALEARWTDLAFPRDPQCRACGDEKHPPPVVDYGPSCTA